MLRQDVTFEENKIKRVALETTRRATLNDKNEKAL